MRQWLAMRSPGNRLATNPVVPRRIFEQGGANLVRGALNVLGDPERTLTGTRVAGRDVAVTLRVVGEYRMGDRAPMSDLMARNAGATRLPARMHRQYPRRLLLDNDRSEGRYPVGGKPVALSDIGLPVFMVGTVTDHIAPWRSIYKSCIT
ncbi:hypothetical protein V4C85_15945 [Ralstonia solanacearum]|nr:hypothetical protein [Ralstonia solanacearum]MBB6592685.1 hypothetical protein [Ralstonia solanacearum]MBB6596909.1 hypothetical protein [Ralstonia solanacearum]